MIHGFLKACTVSPALRVADCAFNTQQTIAAMQRAAADGAQLAVFPELGLTGYTCGDLFFQQPLQRAAAKGLADVLEASADLDLVALPSQSLGQGAGHIGQTAGFCKGGCFRSSIQDLHKIRSFLIKRIHISSRCGKKSGRGYTQYPRPSLRGATGEGAAPMGDSQTVQTMWLF